jgi:hypothetical protein
MIPPSGGVGRCRATLGRRLVNGAMVAAPQSVDATHRREHEEFEGAWSFPAKEHGRQYDEQDSSAAMAIPAVLTPAQPALMALMMARPPSA